MKQCSSCHRLFADAATYCSVCGTGLEAVRADAKKPSEPRQPVKCGHCDGTGVCQRGDSYGKGPASCADCLWASNKQRARFEPKARIDDNVYCAICDGTGYLKF